MPENPRLVQPQAAPSELLTFLIADVRGYTRFTVERGDEQAARLAARFAAIADAAASAHAGRVIELRGDEVLAVFTSTRQALRAALTLQDACERAMQDEPDLPLGVGVGLDAGDAVPLMGGYRSGALNLAARLCSLAGPGEILASEGVLHLARRMDDIDLVERGPVSLKGFDDPVRVLEVHPRTGDLPPKPLSGTVSRDEISPQELPIGGFLGALPEGTLVSRREEVERLNRVVEDAVGGAGRCVFLAGEPGVGKTRLGQELTLTARGKGFVIGAGRCYESRSGVPYYPFIDALQMLYAAAPASIRSRAASAWPYLGKILPEAGTAEAPASDPGHEQERLYRSVAGFVTAMAAETPVAILLDDLHWADGGSLDLLLHLARHTRSGRALLLGTYRDTEIGRRHPLEAAVLELTRESLAERMRVGRLSEDGTAELMETMSGMSSASPELISLLHQRTDGNPFFVAETVRALKESGGASGRDGVWDLKAVGDLEVPEGVRAVIGQRISRLSEQAQTALQAAAVLGQQFQFDDLAGVIEIEEDALERALDEASSAFLLREGRDDSFAFQHALIQQTLYEELSPRRRRRLHVLAGEAIERRPARSRLGQAAELARQFLEGGDTQRAYSWAMAAGDEARAVFAQAEAERQFELAAELARDLEEPELEIRALERLGVTLIAQARYPEAIDGLDRALSLLPVERWDDACLIMSQLCLAHGLLGQMDAGIARARALLDRLPDADPGRGVGMLYGHLTTLYFLGGHPQEGRATAERGLEVGRKLDDPEAFALSGEWLGWAMGGEAGIALVRESYEQAKRINDGFLMRAAGLQLGDLYVALGDLEGARQALARTVELAEQMGNANWIAFGWATYGYVRFLAGAWDDAASALRRATVAASPGLEGFFAAYPPTFTGQLYLARGEVEEGKALLERGVGILREIDDVQGLFFALPVVAEQAILEGDAESAIALLNPMTDAALNMDHFGHLIFTALAWAHLEAGHLDRAGKLVDVGIKQAERFGHLLASGELLRIRALSFARQGRVDEADRDFREAIAICREIGYPYAEAKALVELGRELRSRGDAAAAEVLDGGVAILTGLGARTWIDRTR